MKRTEQSGPVETGDGQRAIKSYPERWGTPPGERFSETRARWVKKNARLEELRSAADPETRRRRLVRAQDARMAAIRDVVADLHERHGRR